MTARAPDHVVPGSVRVEHVAYDRQLMTVRCGGCGSEQDVHTFNHTSRCRQCGRVCRFRYTPAAAEGNVVPLRRAR